ncbi:hypothetical protein [Streptomyces sp. NPDC046197]|uniref:hypothetical protein n=1 Tax=Streptomyces sp. NPDC046197 TaxID=3154337 RepID=UPI0033CFADE6
MRKYHRAAVAVAMLGSVSFLGAGVGHAADGDSQTKADPTQNQTCSANESAWQGLVNIHDVNLVVNLLGLQTSDLSKHKSVQCNQALSPTK